MQFVNDSGFYFQKDLDTIQDEIRAKFGSKQSLNSFQSNINRLVGEFEGNGGGGGEEWDFLKYDQLQLKNFLGHGSVSKVYTIAQHEAVVVKFPINKRRFNIILSEYLILKFLYSNNNDNNNIIPVLGLTYLTKKNYNKIRANEIIPGIVLPRLDMTLQGYYQKLAVNDLDYSDPGLKTGVRSIWWELLRQTTDALCFLKERSVMHNDIKTANILIDLNGSKTLGSSNKPICYISDFTSSVYLSEDNENTGYQQSDTLDALLNARNSMCTTLEYCSPEVLSQFNNEATITVDTLQSFYRKDFYSLGLCMLAFIVNNEPYHKVKDMKFRSHQNVISSFESSQWLLNIILQNKPIKFNIQYDNGLSNNAYFQKFWEHELNLVRKILKDKITLHECRHLINSRSN